MIWNFFNIFNYFNTFTLTVFILTAYLIPTVMLFIVPANRKPSSATSWILLVYMVPIFGLFIFLYLGSPKLPPNRRAKQHQMTEYIRENLALVMALPQYLQIFDPPILGKHKNLVNLITHLGGMSPFGGNQLRLLPDYAEALATIAAAIDQAQHYAHLEYYTFSRDDETEVVFLAMERAQQRGVKVRVLLDHLGSRKYPGFKTLQSQLAAAGIESHMMLPIKLIGRNATRLDLRNHRKIVVIDGNVGFTGSQNMIRRNYFRKDEIYYDELVVQIHGPVAHQLNAAFITDWYSETGVRLNPQKAPELGLLTPQSMGESLCQILPSGSGFEDENNLKLFTAVMYTARQKIVITNPYFVPDDALMTAITSAAQRGVEVTLFNSEATDQFLVSHAQRSYYEQLLNAGVRIYWYKAPILLHAKHISVDNDIAIIGSSNLDIRSFELNMEVTLITYDPRVVEMLRAVEANYLDKSRLINVEEWKARSLGQKLPENISRLTSGLQ